MLNIWLSYLFMDKMPIRPDDVDLKELECYTKIINLFKKISKDSITIETWKDKTIIKLMKVLRRRENKRWVKNALIILLSLFDDNPPDLFSSLGNNIELLSNKEKEEVVSKLREEFTSK